MSPIFAQHTAETASQDEAADTAARVAAMGLGLDAAVGASMFGIWGELQAPAPGGAEGTPGGPTAQRHADTTIPSFPSTDAFGFPFLGHGDA